MLTNPAYTFLLKQLSQAKVAIEAASGAATELRRDKMLDTECLDMGIVTDTLRYMEMRVRERAMHTDAAGNRIA